MHEIFGNGLGDVVHMRERECSVQRRHQKVIEESPSPFCTSHPGIFRLIIIWVISDFTRPQRRYVPGCGGPGCLRQILVCRLVACFFPSKS